MKNLPFFAKTVGRRKTSVVNLELVPGNGKILVNECYVEEFFFGHLDRLIVRQSPLRFLNHIVLDVKVKSYGGGLKGQSKALELALARALFKSQPMVHNLFYESRFLTRDSREKERRKYGLKKARKSPQFSKR
jgi:small subunit ribosomal protein S9